MEYIKYAIEIMGTGLSKQNKNIDIQGDKFIRIQYERNKKKYYMLLPINENDDIRKKLISLIYQKDDIKEDIYINDILECKLKVKGKKEMDISSNLETYMGPDQLYKDNKNIIRIRDILPEKYINTFEYVKTLNEEMEYKTYSNLDDYIFADIED